MNFKENFRTELIFSDHSRIEWTFDITSGTKTNTSRLKRPFSINPFKSYKFHLSTVIANINAALL